MEGCLKFNHERKTMKESRQVTRRKLFDAHFERFDGQHVPKGLDSRRERRNLARAYAVGARKRNG